MKIFNKQFDMIDMDHITKKYFEPTISRDMINLGWCMYWAKLAVELYKEQNAKFVLIYYGNYKKSWTHVCVVIEDKYYDSDNPKGIYLEEMRDSWGDVNISVCPISTLNKLNVWEDNSAVRHYKADSSYWMDPHPND